MKNICKTCEGNGKFFRLINYSGFHYDGGYPIEEEEVCEDCDRTGEEQNEY